MLVAVNTFIEGICFYIFQFYFEELFFLSAYKNSLYFSCFMFVVQFIYVQYSTEHAPGGRQSDRVGLAPVLMCVFF